MLKKRENSISFNTKSRLIYIPILISLISVIFIPVLLEILLGIIFKPSVELITVSGTIGMALNFILTLFIITKLSKIKISDLGLEFKGAFDKSIIGILCGLLAISLVAISIKILGGVNIIYNFKIEYLGTILLGLVFFIFQGTYEELIYRSYLMPHFSKSIGKFFAIILSSVLFTFLHALNPGMTIMPVINLFIASLVFSLVYYIYGNLWLSGFIHAIWNYSQGFIYGSLVSGISLKQTVLKSIPIQNKDLISGGNFGFEGSISTSVLGIILIILLLRLIQKNKIK
ncbi:MAG: CPBP family intramembrane metalloprotease [Oceanivirga sp.]|nr:CPBP family intramembrane metalloprotease [Oceanivirga sp.]